MPLQQNHFLALSCSSELPTLDMGPRASRGGAETKSFVEGAPLHITPSRRDDCSQRTTLERVSQKSCERDENGFSEAESPLSKMSLPFCAHKAQRKRS